MKILMINLEFYGVIYYFFGVRACAWLALVSLVIDFFRDNEKPMGREKEENEG